MLTFFFGGVELSAADFPRDARGYIAFSIAFANATGCRDKDAALELLLYEADKLINVATTGMVPGP